MPRRGQSRSADAPEVRAVAALDAAAIAHDIRNSLSTIKIAVQALAGSESLTERGQRRLALARREVDAIDALLGKLPGTSRSKPGGGNP